MAPLQLRLDPGVVARIDTLSHADRAIVAENISAVLEDPRAGHPSSLRVAKPKAWQHKCPHSFVVLYRCTEGDPLHPAHIVTIERLVDCYG